MPRKEERIGYINEIVLEGSSGDSPARVSDLSPGGCFIDTIATGREGEVLKFQLASKDGRSMDFQGRVAYIMPATGFGVEFTNLTPAHKTFLKSLLATS